MTCLNLRITSSSIPRHICCREVYHVGYNYSLRVMSRGPQPRSKLQGTKLSDVRQTYRLFIAHDTRHLSMLNIVYGLQSTDCRVAYVINVGLDQNCGAHN